MKKRILAVVLSIAMVLSFMPVSAFTAAAASTQEIVFNLGANGSAVHADGTSKTTFSETNGAYTLSVTNGTNFYTGARDAKGNSCFKLGASSSSKTGSFKFVVPDDVVQVIVYVAKYKEAKNAAKVTINGTTTTISSISNNGQYDAITVDTTTNKTVSVATVSGSQRAMVNTITYVVEVAGSACEHEYDNECDVDCNLCGITREIEHDYEETAREDATCTSKGSITYTCSVCGNVKTQDIAIIAHNMVAGEVVEPTLESEGYTIYTCSACGLTENRDFTDKVLPEGTTEIKFELGADGDAGKESTATKTTYTETVDGYTLNITGGNKMYPACTDGKGNGCIKIGSSNGVGGFSFTVPDEVSVVIIKVAKYKANTTKISVNGTAYTISGSSNDGKYDEIQVDTSSEKTVTLTTVSGGARAMVDSIAFRIIVAAECEHSYESDTTDATCTEDGKTVYTCSKCGDSYEEIITSTGHKYESVVTAPTCTDKGYTTHTCSVCNDSYVDSYTDAAGHSYKSVVTAPTCTTDGFTTHTCSACGNSYTDSTVAASHKYSSAVTAPTCTEDGFTTYTCTACGDSYTDSTVAATGHSYDSVKVAPSATDTGYTKHTCSACGDVSVSDPVLPKNGKVHNVKATTKGDRVTITWDSLTAVNKYIVYIYAMDGTLVKCAQKTTNAAAFTGIKVGEYVVLVIAKTSKGWSEFLCADEVAFEVTKEEVEEEQQKSPTASGEVTPNYVKITWPAVEGAVKYTVMIVGNGEKIYRAATTNVAYVFGLKPATEYKIYVNAKTTKYIGYGEATTITTAGNLNASIAVQTLKPTSVTFTWDAVPNGEKYFLMIESEEGTKYYSTSNTYFKINGLDAEKTYTAYINTRTAGKNYSGYTSSVTFTTPKTEGITLSSKLKADGAHLSWTSGLPFDKVWVKEILSDGTEKQHAALSGAIDNFTVDVYEEGTRQFYLIVRVITEKGKDYVDSNTITVKAPAPKEVEVATEEELKSALAAAKVGEIVRITLTEDITTTIADDANVIFTVAKNTDVILNLNGKKITAILPDNEVTKSESVFYVSQDSTFAVEGNGSIDAIMGTNSAQLTTIFNNCGATLLIVDGSYSLTLEEGKKAYIADIVDNNSTSGETKTTIINGYFTTSSNIGNMFRNFANHKTESCSLIIEGGKFVSEFSSASYPKAVFWNQAPNANTKGTGYIDIVRGSFSGLEVENEHPAANVTIGKKAFIGVYGTATYVESTEELKSALANGGYIVVKGDIDLSAAEGAEITGNVITKNTVLDLNGHTISYTAEYVPGMNGTQISAITVDNGATLVIGNGTVDASSFYALYAKEGTLVVESGSYSAITSAVQVNEASVTINGGKFEGSETYLLNCLDAAYNNGDAKITVKGGEFVGFNPADNAAEGTGTNFVAEGYKVIEKNGTYIVVSEDYEEPKGITTEEALKAAIANGEKEIEIAGPITLTSSFNAIDVTFIGVTEDAAINFEGNNIAGAGSITYKDLALSTIALNDAYERTGFHGGIDYMGHSVANYENCVITGVFTTYSPEVNVTGCTFNYYVQDGEEYYGMFVYTVGVVNATDCTFMYGDRAIKVYSEGPADIELNIYGCKFVATEDYKLNKVLINVDSTYLSSLELNIGNLEIDEKLSSLAIHNGEGNSKVTISNLANSGQDIQDAGQNPDQNITLGGDIDLNDLIGGLIP